MEDPGRAPKRRAVFLDRDGTLMYEVNFCRDPAQVRIVPGAAESLAELRRHGWLNIIVTNQSGIGRGCFTTADYQAVNAELFRQLGGSIDADYFSPDHPDHATPRRKPGTGMIEEASREHDIAPERSWFIGDKDSDVLCGRTAGCRTILVLTGYGRQYRDCGADFIARDIMEAAQIVLRETK
ncbi:MAG: HAD family hydrolase [Terrimicrobiaceae bacterium]